MFFIAYKRYKGINGLEMKRRSQNKVYSTICWTWTIGVPHTFLSFFLFSPITLWKPFFDFFLNLFLFNLILNLIYLFLLIYFILFWVKAHTIFPVISYTTHKEEKNISKIRH